MKLHEEFKLFETMWEEPSEEMTSEEMATEVASTPVIKTFGRKTYDLSKPDELRAWFEANYELQKQRHPERYADSDPARGIRQNSNRQNLRATIAKNLLASLEAEGVTDPDIIGRLQELADTNAWFGRLFRDGEIDRTIEDMTAKLTKEEKQLIRPELDSIRQKLISIRKKSKKMQEAITPQYTALCAKMETKFKEAMQEADFAWMNAVIELGADYGYFNSRAVAKLRKAVAANIAKGMPNNAAQDLARTGDPKVDAEFQHFLEEEASRFDAHLDFFNWLCICYMDGTFEFFDSYEDTFAGNKDDIECLVGIDYASGASIAWIRGEDTLEDLDYLLEENG